MCSRLDAAVTALERDGEHVLLELSQRTTKSNLDGVKRVKCGVTALLTRVQTVRDEIERYLDNEGDMRELYLTRKARGRDAAALDWVRARGDEAGLDAPFDVSYRRVSIDPIEGRWGGLADTTGATDAEAQPRVLRQGRSFNAEEHDIQARIGPRSLLRAPPLRWPPVLPPGCWHEEEAEEGRRSKRRSRRRHANERPPLS